MSLEISQILRQHLPALVKGEEVDPDPEVLDITWRHMSKNDRHFLEHALNYGSNLSARCIRRARQTFNGIRRLP